MKGPWFVETLAANGDVLHRHQLAQLPIRLGRGYDNDVILDDAHVAPRHAVVELSAAGAPVLRDLGSRNGMVHKGRRSQSVLLDGDTVVRLGHTSLRVRPADHPVAPELLDRTMHRWEGALPGFAGALLVGAVSLFLMWLADTQSFELVRYLQAVAYGLGAALLWSGIWAFANRLFGRHARLGRHLFIFGCGAAALTLYRLATSALGYAWSLEPLTRYGSHVAIALVAGMVWFHLATVRPQRTRRYGFICVALALLGSGLAFIANEQRSGRLGDELYMSVLMPPELRASRDHSVDEFMGQVGAMKARLDVERASKDKDEGDG
ncbi:FHA domain-containing protein [Massilia solisilvae]|uniref:FHA domain-containing protein n=1 Tax=Massilia solisilvae TaxID=1811225 RepID=A0ABT2BHV4_9BURK|nr:FHA domain-containing protein [Massilia solisilvae]MCS0607473.1 FHA domain-containing protein [Massilia solisilvae]